MEEKEDIKILLKNFVQRKDNKDIDALIKKIIDQLQINDDPNMQLFGKVIQDINNYWSKTYEELRIKSLNEWIERNDKLAEEMDRSQLYFGTLKDIKNKTGKNIYKPYIEEYECIYTYNLNADYFKPIKKNLDNEEMLTKLGYIESESSKIIIPFNKDEERRRLIGKLSNEEKNVLRNNETKMIHFAAFLILCFRHINDSDFNELIGINKTYDFQNLSIIEKNELTKIYEKFNSTFKTANSRKNSKSK